jgi:hypothetical protein
MTFECLLFLRVRENWNRSTQFRSNGPGRACRREMKVHIGVSLEPVLVLLVGVEIVEDDMKLAVRKSRGDAVHEVEELDTAPPF